MRINRKRLRIAVFFAVLTVSFGATKKTVKSGSMYRPKERANRLYMKITQRISGSPIVVTDPGTNDAFPGVPVEVGRALTTIATDHDKEDIQRALHDLSGKLEDTGFYSKVKFRGKPRKASVKYKKVNTDRVFLADKKWSILSIGTYYAWVETDGVAVTPEWVQYDIIDEKEIINLQ